MLTLNQENVENESLLVKKSKIDSFRKKRLEFDKVLLPSFRQSQYTSPLSCEVYCVPMKKVEYQQGHCRWVNRKAKAQV